MAIDIGSSLKGISGVFAGIGSALPYIFVFLGLVGLGLWFYFDKQYNKQIILFKVVGEGFRLISDRAKLVRQGKEVPFWKLKKLKRTVDVPSDNCLVSSAKGETAFGYVTTVGEITWAAPEYHPEKLLAKIAATGEDSLDADEKKHYNFLKTFRPVNTTQRASLAWQLEKANEEVKSDWKQHLPLIISGVVLLLVLAIFMMFFGKVSEPIIAMSDSLNAGDAIRLQQLEILERIEQRVQLLDGGVIPSSNNVNNPR